MNKLIALIISSLGLCSLISCQGDNSHSYSLTLENHEGHLVNPLKSHYKEGEKVEVTTHVLYDASLEIFLNDEKIEQTWSDIPHWRYEFVMPAINSVLDFRITNGLHSSESIHDYVTFNDFVLPSDYFDCQFYDITKGEMFSINYWYDIVGNSLSNSYHYEYEMIADVPNYQGNNVFIIDKMKVYDDIFLTEKVYTSGTNEPITYQYIQLKNEEGYILNETDNVLNASPISVNGIECATTISPSYIDLLHLDTQEISYKKGIKDDLTFYFISGIYTDSNKMVYSQVAAEIVYVFKDNKIIAWHYKETATSLEAEGYWQTTKFCIPKNDDIVLVDEEILISLAN